MSEISPEKVLWIFLPRPLNILKVTSNPGMLFVKSTPTKQPLLQLSSTSLPNHHTEPLYLSLNSKVPLGSLVNDSREFQYNLGVVTPGENPGAKYIWNWNQSKGEIKWEKPIYFLQAVIHFCSPMSLATQLQKKPSLSGPDKPSLTLVITCWYGDGLLLSTPWKHLFIWRCTKARQGIQQILKFNQNRHLC